MICECVPMVHSGSLNANSAMSTAVLYFVQNGVDYLMVP